MRLLAAMFKEFGALERSIQDLRSGSSYDIYGIYALVFRVNLPPHGMVPPDPGPGHNVPPLGYLRLLTLHICLYSLT